MTETPILDEGAVSEIENRANAASPGPWESDNAEDSEHRYQYYMAIDPASRVLFDTFNSALGEIHEEADEDGVYRWDEVARRNIAFASHAREDIPALCATVKHLRERERTIAAVNADWLEERQQTIDLAESLKSQIEQLRTASLRNAQLIDRIRAWSKCDDGYPLDEHINNITVEHERLKNSRRVHELDNHHNALACGYCAGPLRDEVTRLQSQLEQLRAENEELKKHWADTSEDLASAWLKNGEIQERLAQVEQERNALQKGLKEHCQCGQQDTCSFLRHSAGSKTMSHQTEVIGNRKLDNSLIYQCVKCRKTGLGLLGPCSPPSGRTGRRKKL